LYVHWPVVVIVPLASLVRIVFVVPCPLEPTHTSIAGVTVKVAEPDLSPDVAVIVAVPTDRPVAMPGDMNVATPMVPEVQIAILLMSRLVLSE
jgi:hypothetical protein